MPELADAVKTFSPPPLEVPAASPEVHRSRRAKRQRLTLRQQAFIHHYATPSSPTFGLGGPSYALAHPGVTPGASRVGAVRTLTSDNAREKILAELKAWGFDKERLQHELGKNLQACWDAKKFADHRAAIETLAKLRGDWTEKAEVRTLDDTQKDAIRRIVVETLTVTHEPTNT